MGGSVSRPAGGRITPLPGAGVPAEDAAQGRVPPAAAPLEVAAPASAERAREAHAALVERDLIAQALREAGLLASPQRPAARHDRQEAACCGEAAVRAIVRAMVGVSTLAAAGTCIYNLLTLAISKDAESGSPLYAGLVASVSVLSALCVLDAARVGFFMLEEIDPLPPGLAGALLRRAGASAAIADELDLILQPVLSSILIVAILLTQPVEPGGDFTARVAYPAAVSLTTLMRSVLRRMDQAAGLALQAGERPATTVEVLDDDEPAGPAAGSRSDASPE